MWRKGAVVAFSAILIVGVSACSSSDSDSDQSASPSPTSSPTAAGGNSTAEFNKEIQEELDAVGCMAGPVDGILGPQSDAAIVRFQEAAGIEVDGELGPQTESELKRAAAAGDTVCTTPTASPTTTPTPTKSPAGKPRCNATALGAALDADESVVAYQCEDLGDGERWAGGTARDSGGVEYPFFAKSKGSQWERVSPDEVCGTADAGLGPILDYCDTSSASPTSSTSPTG
ncbi:MAG: peptidoglycan-binding protein [Actinomycetia bacterium]|nr:peptidoglycan-binding protein [Actinomycetes bacterium]MCH9801456.1 peptidoglycan-binding protein [Actinomycetes bacterium]